MSRKRYIYSEIHKKYMLVGKDGELVNEEQKPQCIEEFKRKIKSLSYFRNDKDSGNGFRPHFSKELGGWISSRSEFDKKCKEKGFSCAGDTPPPQHVEKADEKSFDDSDIKSLIDSGESISDNEAKAIKEM